MPKTILNLAVLLYTIGFGIYLLYLWLYCVEPEGGSNYFRNILVSFVATAGLLYIYAVIIGYMTYKDSWKITVDFDLEIDATFAKPTVQRQLEE